MWGSFPGKSRRRDPPHIKNLGSQIFMLGTPLILYVGILYVLFRPPLEAHDQIAFLEDRVETVSNEAAAAQTKAQQMEREVARLRDAEARAASMTTQQLRARVLGKSHQTVTSENQESPRQTKPKKGPKRKVHEFRPFL